MGARRLVVVRHAKAAHPLELADRERPLAPRGEREAELAGRVLADVLPADAVVLVSPAVRTASTWRIAAAALPSTLDVRTEPRIYAAAVDELVEAVADAPDGASTVVIVGHNPGCAELIEWLTGDEVVSFPTSAVAVLDTDDPWDALRSARLVSLTVPR